MAETVIHVRLDRLMVRELRSMLVLRGLSMRDWIEERFEEWREEADLGDAHAQFLIHAQRQDEMSPAYKEFGRQCAIDLAKIEAGIPIVYESLHKGRKPRGIAGPEMRTTSRLASYPPLEVPR